MLHHVSSWRQQWWCCSRHLSTARRRTTRHYGTFYGRSSHAAAGGSYAQSWPSTCSSRRLDSYLLPICTAGELADTLSNAHAGNVRRHDKKGGIIHVHDKDDELQYLAPTHGGCACQRTENFTTQTCYLHSLFVTCMCLMTLVRSWSSLNDPVLYLELFAPGPDVFTSHGTSALRIIRTYFFLDLLYLDFTIVSHLFCWLDLVMPMFFGFDFPSLGHWYTISLQKLHFKG